MIIDAHVHVLPPALRNRRDEVAQGDAWFATCHTGERAIATADELIAAMDESGIERSVCLGWPFADRALREETNEYLAAVQQRHPGRLVGFGIVDPSSADAADELSRCRQRGLAGIGELNCDAQNFSLDDPRVSDSASLSVELGLIWNLHCSEPVGHDYAGKGTATPDRVARFAMRNASLELICAHLGGGLPFYAHMPEVAQLCRRLWFDTAAVPFLYEPSAYRAVVELCGADRLLFGSDFPLLRLERYRTGIDAAALGEDQAAMLMGRNAAALLSPRSAIVRPSVT